MNTSTIARDQFLADGKDHIHYKIILKALRNRVLSGVGIAKYCKLDRYQVGRRLKEMEGLGLIEYVDDRECKVYNKKLKHYKKAK